MESVVAAQDNSVIAATVAASAGMVRAVDSPNGDDRSKRRRRAPATFKSDLGDMDNEQLRLLQVAVENSRAENVASDVHIDDAPTFRPTIEEFQDPIKYISRYNCVRFALSAARSVLAVRTLPPSPPCYCLQPPAFQEKPPPPISHPAYTFHSLRFVAYHSYSHILLHR